MKRDLNKESEETGLMPIAAKLCEEAEYWFRDEDGKSRPLTDEEHDLLQEHYYAALQGMRWHGVGRHGVYGVGDFSDKFDYEMESKAAQAIMDALEFFFIEKWPDCNAYMTVYVPLYKYINCVED